jgi:hypothetical protein
MIPTNKDPFYPDHLHQADHTPDFCECVEPDGVYCCKACGNIVKDCEICTGCDRPSHYCHCP